MSVDVETIDGVDGLASARSAEMATARSVAGALPVSSAAGLVLASGGGDDTDGGSIDGGIDDCCCC